MLVTREADYAFRILRRLSPEDRISLKEICELEKIPQQFAYKIIRKLAKGGVVDSHRGPEGGNLLTADLKKISLYEVLKMIGEREYIMNCAEPGYVCNLKGTGTNACTVHNNMMKIQEKLDKELKRYSIHQILFEE